MSCLVQLSGLAYCKTMEGSIDVKLYFFISFVPHQFYHVFQSTSHWIDKWSVIVIYKINSIQFFFFQGQFGNGGFKVEDYITKEIREFACL